MSAGLRLNNIVHNFNIQMISKNIKKKKKMKIGYVKKINKKIKLKK